MVMTALILVMLVSVLLDLTNGCLRIVIVELSWYSHGYVLQLSICSLKSGCNSLLLLSGLLVYTQAWHCWLVLGCSSGHANSCAWVCAARDQRLVHQADVLDAKVQA
jgi:hypothetical protein